MPKKYPPLTPDEVVAILLARGFVLHRTRGSHAHYRGIIKGVKCLVTVDMHYKEFDVGRIKDMMQQANLSREEFYGSTKKTAKKINLIAPEYPIPLK
ncbi:MAG TPA: addiction module toxin, HicA family [Anaerolineae bacterium]|nr:addiction module toxin, HicA family [Anaerolineae bacterium]